MTDAPEGPDGGGKARLSVSLDPEVAAWLRTSAAAAGANMSEYVQALAEDRRRREAWMGRWVAAAGEPDRDAMERARRALGVEDQHAARRRRAS